MNKKIRWAILGLGNIAHKFAQDLKHVPYAELVAVGSRTREKADDFAKQYGVPHAFPDYKSLVHFPNVDIVYIATPHTFHMENTLDCLQAGKAVLCEKPFALNHHQAKKMIELAQAKNLFLMDAIWTQFFPFMQQIREILDKGSLGKIRMLEADFGFYKAFDPQSRLYDLALGGGALLDIGIYPIFLTLALFGKPSSIQASSILNEDGIDISTSVIMSYPDGKLSNTFSTVVSETRCEAKIYGEHGSILVPGRWHEADHLILSTQSGKQNFEYKRSHLGYAYEIESIHVALQANRIEHELLPHTFTLDLMEILDTIREQVGIRYPSEQ